MRLDELGDKFVDPAVKRLLHFWCDVRAEVEGFHEHFQTIHRDLLPERQHPGGFLWCHFPVFLEQVDVCTEDAHVSAITQQVAQHFVGDCGRLLEQAVSFAKVVVQLALHNRHGRFVALVPLQQFFDVAIVAFRQEDWSSGGGVHTRWMSSSSIIQLRFIMQELQ